MLVSVASSTPAAQRFVTQHQKDDVDLFSGHGITVTRFSDSLWFTAGYSYTTLHKRSLRHPHLRYAVWMRRLESLFRRLVNVTMLSSIWPELPRSRRICLMPTCFGCRSRTSLF